MIQDSNSPEFGGIKKSKARLTLLVNRALNSVTLRALVDIYFEIPIIHYIYQRFSV